jgi:hypothetical protein
MERLWIEVSVVNATDELRLGDSGLMPTDFDEDQVGKLFRDLRAEHGRCVGKVYHDTRAEEAVPIGWVFQKRDHYADNAGRHYLREAWVTVFTGPRMFRLRRRRKRK